MTGSIDVVTIFPDYLRVLDLSLIGKARERGTLRVGVHDLRDWTQDAHRTVDDTPAGGGAGMVMRPDVWGEALDDLLARRPEARETPDATIIVPTPAGEPFTQRIAEELAADLGAGSDLILACGRYEGIDARVADHYACRPGLRVRELSIGDYVLNGGEVAAVVMIEAIGRLLPGVLGNPDSLVEESHGGAGLLEYPVYTAPAEWRGLDIPPVLRSGDHARIESWRRARAVRRTAEVRPDLLSGHEVALRRAAPRDAGALAGVAARTFALACPPDFPAEAADAFVTENLTETQFRRWAKSRHHRVRLAEIAGAVVGYAVLILDKPAPAGEPPSAEQPERAAARIGDLNKFYVLPEHHGHGVAHALMDDVVVAATDAGMRGLWLGVNQRNTRAQAFYRRHGFHVAADRTFLVGGRTEKDFVMARTLSTPAVSSAGAHVTN